MRNKLEQKLSAASNFNIPQLVYDLKVKCLTSGHDLLLIPAFTREYISSNFLTFSFRRKKHGDG